MVPLFLHILPAHPTSPLRCYTVRLLRRQNRCKCTRPGTKSRRQVLGSTTTSRRCTLGLIQLRSTEPNLNPTRILTISSCKLLHLDSTISVSANSNPVPLCDRSVLSSFLADGSSRHRHSGPWGFPPSRNWTRKGHRRFGVRQRQMWRCPGSVLAQLSLVYYYRELLF